MLRRGWPTVLLLVVICVGGVFAYLNATAKQYSTSSTIVVLPNDPKTFTDLEQGSQFAADRASTYAQIINSPQVLDSVAQQLHTGETAQQLEGQVSAGARGTTSIIDISVTAGSAQSAVAIANAVANGAATIIPTVVVGPAPSSTLVTVDVLRSATGSTVSPDPSRILGIGVALGLVLGLVTTIARQSLDTKLRLPGDVQSRMLAPLLGVVPRLQRGRRAGITVRDDPSALAGDSYRSLRTNLSDLGGRGSRSLLVVGVSDRESAAQVALNLAWSFAQAGRPVLFMDLDMRQSPADAMLGIHSGRGMADVLDGGARLSEVLQPTSQPKLWVASSGVATSNPADLLSSAGMAQALTEAKAHYETVVVLVPPLLSFTDGALVAMAADQTLLTLSAGHTRVAELTEAVEILRNARTEPVGLVLCGVRGTMRKPQGRLRTEGPSGTSEPADELDPPAVRAPAAPVSSARRPTPTTSAEPRRLGDGLALANESRASNDLREILAPSRAEPGRRRRHRMNR